jgi:alkylhydroperoxidase family enzyme
VAAALEDHTSAPISARLRAALTFLEKLCRDPDGLTPADAQQALAAGVSKDALRDAVWVCMCFSVLTRAADALGWRLLDEAGVRRSARRLWRRGYA